MYEEVLRGSFGGLGYFRGGFRAGDGFCGDAGFLF